MCGEYGGAQTQRPHYHAAIFGHDFDDKVLYAEREGVPLYTSDKLAKLWGKGFVTIGEVNFKSAAYIARYVMKKVTGEAAAEHYEICDPITGEIYQRVPEYNRISNGVGKGWFEKYKSDAYPSDFLIVNGHKVKPPKYFDMLLEQEDPELFAEIKAKRQELAVFSQDNSDFRLHQREICAKSKLKNYSRSLE